jgi:predicted permease
MVVQIALSLALLVSTGLFAGTLRNLQRVNPGFNTASLLVFQIDAASAGYTQEQFSALHASLEERLEDVPGVSAATFSRVALLTGGRATRRVSVPDSASPGAPMGVNINGVAPNFFTTMQIPLIAGRSFDNRDTGAAPRVAIVNQAFARRLFDKEDPIGRKLDFGATPTASAAQLGIVGVVGDTKYTGLREAAPPTIFLPAAQMLEGTANFYVRTGGEPASVGAAIRAAVRQIDATLPVIDLRTEDEQIDRLTSEDALFARLSGFFGVVTLTLACVGLYGLMSYLVLRRTGEIGLRIALGALPSRVLRMILREALALVALGLFVGLTVAVAGSRFIGSMLFGLSPADPMTYGSAATILIGVALLAALVPAFRAAHVEPMTALRAD